VDNRLNSNFSDLKVPENKKKVNENEDQMTMIHSNLIELRSLIDKETIRRVKESLENSLASVQVSLANVKVSEDTSHEKCVAPDFIFF
jgi:hypothetical protein